MAAAIYGVRAGLRSLSWKKRSSAAGLLPSIASIIIGFPEGITGPELRMLCDEHLRRFDIGSQYAQVEVYLWTARQRSRPGAW